MAASPGSWSVCASGHADRTHPWWGAPDSGAAVDCQGGRRRLGELRRCRRGRRFLFIRMFGGGGCCSSNHVWSFACQNLADPRGWRVGRLGGYRRTTGQGGAFIQEKGKKMKIERCGTGCGNRGTLLNVPTTIHGLRHGLGSFVAWGGRGTEPPKDIRGV
jgi:hypothetical protein